MIEIVRTYTVEAPPDRVWQLLMDTTALSSCIPGCETLDQDPETERRYLIRLAVKLAAVMGRYDGSVQLVDIVPMTSVRVAGRGPGPSRIRQRPGGDRPDALR